MTAALALVQKHRNVLLIDLVLLAALYVLPAVSHVTALPLYMLEPMRVALIVALLFTNRANATFIAFTIPLMSYLISGHPALFKAFLMGIEYSILVAAYTQVVRLDRMPAFVALTAAILAGKIVYYLLKLAALNVGLLSGKLVSTPLQYQFLLAVGTAAVFAVVEYYRAREGRRGRA
jgi:hypothetical protein